MINRWVRPQGKKEIEGRFIDVSLKVCPICNTITVSSCRECFVCWWHGEFIYDNDLVEMRLRDLVSKCPELIGLLDSSPKPWTKLKWMWHRMSSIWRQKLDVNA